MFKMISAEFYKLRKSRSFWIMLAVILGMAAFMSIVLGISSEELMETGMRPDTVGEMLETAAGLMTTIILFMLVGFTITFMSNDFDSGTIRNSFAVGTKRIHYLVAKFVMILIACAVFLIAGISVAGLAYMPFESFGTGFNFGNFLMGIGISYLSLIAQATLFMAIAVMARKIGATLGIVLGYIVFDLLVGTFVTMLEVEGIVARLASFLPSGSEAVSHAVSTGTAYTSDVVIFVVMMVGLVVVSSLLAVRNLVKKDI